MKLTKLFNNGGRCVGLIFECPACGYSHKIQTKELCEEGSTVLWEWNGNEEKPTVKPSIKVSHPRPGKEEYVCHSYITNGTIRFDTDSTHQLAGRTIDLPEL